MNIEVSQLSIYPVKSAGRIALTKMDFDYRGPVGDRSWMVVDKESQFISQRQFPKMCLIDTTVKADGLELSAPNKPLLKVSRYSKSTNHSVVSVVVWGDSVNAVDCGDQSAEWLSDYLKHECRLVYMPEHSRRLVDVAYAKQQQTVGFADGFPLLVVSEASLTSLNNELSNSGSQNQIDMWRFRPNIVISGCEPYAEDDWQIIQINDLVLSLVKPCSRCVIPAIDQSTGQKQLEVIDVLNKTRRIKQKTFFGQNALHDRPGRISLGDTVKIIK